MKRIVESFAKDYMKNFRRYVIEMFIEREMDGSSTDDIIEITRNVWLETKENVSIVNWGDSKDNYDDDSEDDSPDFNSHEFWISDDFNPPNLNYMGFDDSNEAVSYVNTEYPELDI